MKKKNLCTLLLLAVVSLANAQTPLYQWTKTFGGINNEYVNGITVDKKGNVYAIGSFTGSIDIDPGTPVTTVVSKGSSDIFITKLDAKGKLLWSKNMGSTGSDVGYSIALDTAGNVYATGSFQFFADFGSSMTLNSSGSEDVFVAKYDSLGNILWVKGMGGSSTDYGRSIAVDTLGGVYITGKFQGYADFDPSAMAAPLYSNMSTDDIFIVKLDHNGNYQWVKGIGSDGYDVGTAISVDPSGNIFATGLFTRTVNFDPLVGSHNLKSQGLIDVYLAKYDKSGNYLWCKSFGGPDNDYARAITLDNKSNVYVAGYFSDMLTFDPLGLPKGIIAMGGTDAFVAKLDKSGNLSWLNALGGTLSDYAYAISVDGNENVYTTGSFQGLADFDPSANTLNLTSNGIADVFISRLDKNGKGTWATNLGGSSDDEGSAIFVYNNKEIYSAGDFRSTVDFDYGTTIDNFVSSGLSDVYIHKISLTTNAISSSTLDTKIAVYPNPTDGIVNLSIDNAQKETYTITVLDAKGSQVFVQQTESNQAMIDLTRQASGVYFVSLSSIDGVSSKLFSIVKR
jgi:hypothetical protein